MARKRAVQRADAGGHDASGPGTGPGREVDAVLAAARAEVGGLGKGARRRLSRLERKLGTALRVEAKRRRKLGKALGEVAGLVARVREVARPGEVGEPSTPDAPVEKVDEKKTPKRTTPTAGPKPSASAGSARKASPKPSASAGSARKASPKPPASPKSTASARPAPKRRVARRRPGPDAGSAS